MRTFLLGAIFSTAFAISIFAESFTVTVPQGFSALANPFNNSSNTPPEKVFSDESGWLDGCEIFVTDCSGIYQGYTLDSIIFCTNCAQPAQPIGSSGDEEPILAPGRGFYFQNTSGATVSITFTGTVPTAVYPNPYYCGGGGYSLLGSLNTNSSSYQDYTGMAPQEGAQVLFYISGQPVRPYTAQNYTIYTFTNGAWSPTNPPLSIGHSALFYVPSPTPELSINLSRTNVVLTWPTNVGGFALLSATNILPTAWITNSTVPVIVNGQNTVTNPISGGQQFFRLSQ